MLRTDRVMKAIEAKACLLNDFFGGWAEEDLPLFEKYLPAEVEPVTDKIVDCLGINTDPTLHAWFQHPSGCLISGIPIPDDCLHAEAIEYISLFTAFENASASNEFTAVEIGASYGPWACAAGVVAKRLGKESIRLITLEASREKMSAIMQHQFENGLIGNDIISKSIHGAVWTEKKIMYFPKVDITQDNGGQVSSQKVSIDYRGLSVQYDEVPSYTLDEILAPLDRADFLHMDIQGAEKHILNDEKSALSLKAKVKVFFLATHSREIEGIALNVLPKHGFELFRERPVIFQQNSRTENIEGWTLRDGGQIWINGSIR